MAATPIEKLAEEKFDGDTQRDLYDLLVAGEADRHVPQPVKLDEAA